MFNETLWRMNQESRRLQELRLEIGGVWDDTASRELNGRYLNPHEDDDSKMRMAYDQQNADLDQAAEKIVTAHQHGNTAGQLSKQVAETLAVADKEVISAHHAHGLSISEQSEARATLPLVQKFIQEANKAC